MRGSPLVFRSRLPLRTTDALISRVPPKFVDFLAEIPSSAEIEASQALVNQLEAHSTVVRQNRIETLKRHQERLASAAESHLNRLRLIHQRVNQVRAAPFRLVFASIMAYYRVSNVYS